jgi:hypothetical protein
MSQARAANLAATLHVPGPGAFVLLDSVLERMLDDAERPLLGNVGDATPHADMRTTVLQVLAIADSARSLAPPRLESATPVATTPTGQAFRLVIGRLWRPARRGDARKPRPARRCGPARPGDYSETRAMARASGFDAAADGVKRS